MTTNIFHPYKMGKEMFHPQSYDENSFVMNYTLEAGGGVPPHAHVHMDERFSILEGECTFMVNGEKVVKKKGEELFVEKGVVHSVKNTSNGQIAMLVTYSPCADTHRMFEILCALDEENKGSMMNMVKYFYLYPRLGLKEFSAPKPAWLGGILRGVVTVMGKVAGWDKLVGRFR